jgi:hypothetical protein
MKRLDLIIDALESAHYTSDTGVVGLKKLRLNEALAAARELRALHPVAYAENPINFYICKDETNIFIYVSKEKTTTFNKPLYTLDEVTK